VLRWLGNSDPGTAPGGNVASSPSTSIQVSVSQLPGQLPEASLYASIIDGQLAVADFGITDRQRIQDLVSA
jgi:hypothetical protein